MNNQYDLEGYITGMDYHPDAEDFIKRNNKLKKKQKCFEDINCVFEPDCHYDLIKVKVIDEKTDKEKYVNRSVAIKVYDCENKLIGYVDSETAHKIFYLKTKEIHGHIKDVEEHNVTLTITVISLLSEEESKAILDEDNNKIISIYYPQYANMAFGKDVPTFSQFDYALDLGINPNGKTFKSISTAIDKAKERIQQGGKKEPFPISHEHRSFFYDMLIDNAPASTDYLREIRELHGELPGPITNKEAEEVIALIGDPDYTIICPYCHHRVPNMDMCFNCDRSFRKVKIPLYFDDDKKQTETAYKSYKIAQEEQKYNEYNARVILVLVIVVICIVLLCKSCYT